MDPVLAVSDLRKVYQVGEVQVDALCGVTLAVASGELVALPGPSDSGNSTLPKVPALTARENVALVTDISDHPSAAEEALDLVRLSHRLDHFASQLPGGEQQGVAIARAIAKRPDVVLCDEPTSALDATTGAVVLTAIADQSATKDHDRRDHSQRGHRGHGRSRARARRWAHCQRPT